jgi:hypothetical protein
MSKNLIFICCLFISHLVNGQTLRPKIQLLVDSMAKYNQVDDRVVGAEGSVSKQFMRFERLLQQATNEELHTLTKYTNATVRYYAIQAYCMRNGKDFDLVQTIFLRSLRDNSVIKSLSGCRGGSDKLGNYMLSTGWYYCLSTMDTTDIRKLLSPIDSIMIYDTAIQLYHKSVVLRNTRANPKDYNRIREIAIKEKLPVAVLALARYKKQEDIEIISSYLKNEEMYYYAIWAVREFPDITFYPLLLDIFEKKWREKKYDYPEWRILYQALAKYPTDTTVELFDRTINVRNKFKKSTLGRYLNIAITKYPNPNYEKFKDKIAIDSLHLEFLEGEIKAEE